jgi:hypothetical protein
MTLTTVDSLVNAAKLSISDGPMPSPQSIY